MSSATEFALIYEQIAPLAGRREDVCLGIGDDGAVVQVPEGYSVVVALDTLVEDRHFFSGCAPENLAWKSLAVNLSDLAAMGAEPRWALLALSLPDEMATPEWLALFMQGWHSLAAGYGVALIGGDTTRSDRLTVSVTLMGVVPTGQAIQRAGARRGDDIWVSGSIGDAGLALAQLYRNEKPLAEVSQRLHLPQPRVALGQALRGIASAAVDVSDGFLADLDHLLKASGSLGASCYLHQFPFSEPVLQWVRASSNPCLPLTSGDDYELIFTAAPEQAKSIEQLAITLNLRLTKVGTIMQEQSGVGLWHEDQLLAMPKKRGFDHFSDTSALDRDC
jgi:thiamine-monophosphate kinase